MTDANQITCPECDTPQDADNPFCDNCGFRLGRTDTADELKPVPREVALGEATEVERPAVDLDGGAGETVPEGHPAVPSASGSGAREGRNGPGAKPDATTSSSLLYPTPGESGLHSAPESSINRFVITGILWVASVGAAMMLVYFYMSDAEKDVKELGQRQPRQKISIESGPFLQGLDEQVRAFILLTCQRMADDDEECEQEDLLADEYPQETVELDAYEIDSTEVTVGDWATCVDDGKCPDIDYKACQVWTHQGLQISLRVPKVLQRSEMPVSCVTHAEARTFCEANGGSLPTHDQWEKAARGTDGLLFPWGDNWSSDVANWGEMDVVKNFVLGELDGYEWTAPPGSFPDGESPYGAYDMAGNLAEWVQSDDPLIGFARGGSWTSNPFELRTTGRLELKVDARRTDVGFRCAY